MRKFVLSFLFLTYFASSSFAAYGDNPYGDTPYGDTGAGGCPQGYTCMKAEDCKPEKYIKLENITCREKEVCCKLKEDNSGKGSEK